MIPDIDPGFDPWIWSFGIRTFDWNSELRSQKSRRLRLKNTSDSGSELLRKVVWRGTDVFRLERKSVASLLVAYIYIRIKLVMPCFCTVLCTRTCRFFKSLYSLSWREFRRIQVFVGSSERTTKASDHPSSVVPPKASLRLFPFAFPGGSLVTLVLSLIRPLLIRMFEEKKKTTTKKNNNCVLLFLLSKSKN